VSEVYAAGVLVDIIYSHCSYLLVELSTVGRYTRPWTRVSTPCGVGVAAVQWVQGVVHLVVSIILSLSSTGLRDTYKEYNRDAVDTY